jgi:hypothetical protein
MSMMKSITFIIGCGLVVILKNGKWNELTWHPKDHRKDNPNLKTNSLQPREDVMYKFNCTRQLHESIVIEWMCKCECRTHRESCLSKINFKMPKLKIS